MALNSKNGISIFGKNSTASTQAQASPTIGYYYPDSAWKSVETSVNGAKEGVAQSIDYNTALRQATFMSSVFTEFLIARNTESNVYTYMDSIGIGTTFDPSETDIENHASNIAQIINKTNFLMTDEVTTSKIKNKNVTTSKINDYAITYQQLGNILTTSGNAQINSTANGMTVTISQNSNRGNLNVSLTGNSVTNSNNSKITKSTLFSGQIVAVKTVTNENSNNNYKSLYEVSNVKLSSDSLILDSGYVKATYFEASSDKRNKKDISCINDIETIKDIIENTDIVKFKYIDSDDENVGIIAQDIENKLIDGISLINKDDEGFLMVKESKLIYVLWQYVKGLEKRVRELENK